jgi:hypothetical protein
MHLEERENLNFEIFQPEMLDLATLFEVISHNPDTHDEHTFTEY